MTVLQRLRPIAFGEPIDGMRDKADVQVGDPRRPERRVYEVLLPLTAPALAEPLGPGQ